MKLPPINGWTALVVVAGIAGVCLLAYFKVDVSLFGLYSAAVIGLVSQLSKLFPGDPPPPPPPPSGPTVLPPPGGALRRVVLGGIMVLAIPLAGCPQFWKAAPAVLKTAECALAHKDEPWDRVVLECGITPDNEQAILDLVGQQKAREAAIRREAGCKW